MRLIAEGLALLIAVGGFGLMLRGQDERGTRVALVSIMIALTCVDVLTFYLDQFGAMSSALGHLGLLLLIVTYRRWYLSSDAT